jgi:hypothetical protein
MNVIGTSDDSPLYGAWISTWGIYVSMFAPPPITHPYETRAATRAVTHAVAHVAKCNAAFPAPAPAPAPACSSRHAHGDYDIIGGHIILNTGHTEKLEGGNRVFIIPLCKWHNNQGSGVFALQEDTYAIHLVGYLVNRKFNEGQFGMDFSKAHGREASCSEYNAAEMEHTKYCENIHRGGRFDLHDVERIKGAVEIPFSTM